MTTKTKTKQYTEVISTEESPSLKRQRMKDVRSMVASAIKHDKRVDLMGFVGTDIPRTQIALQDLLLAEKEKHAKARDHIIDQKQAIEILVEILGECSDILCIVSENSTFEIARLSKMANNYADECARLRDGWRNSQEKEQALRVLLKDAL